MSRLAQVREPAGIERVSEAVRFSECTDGCISAWILKLVQDDEERRHESLDRVGDKIQDDDS